MQPPPPKFFFVQWQLFSNEVVSLCLNNPRKNFEIYFFWGRGEGTEGNSRTMYSHLCDRLKENCHVTSHTGSFISFYEITNSFLDTQIRAEVIETFPGQQIFEIVKFEKKKFVQRDFFKFEILCSFQSLQSSVPFEAVWSLKEIFW